MYYTQEQIDWANQADLVLFLQSQGEQLERAGQEYRWKRHDSLTVWGNKWYRHSQSKGGGPVDFVMEFFGRSFTEAVELLAGEKGAAPPPDRPSSAPLSDFRLPPRSPDNCIARNYLTAARRIDEDVTGFFFATGDIYEEAAHHNAVFVGRDESGIPRYAHQRGTAGNFRLDVKGSDKAFNFCYRANLTDTKTLPISEWKQEYADLKEQRDTDYTKLKAARAEVAELQKIRKCVDIALKADQPEQTRAKRHDIDR